jgi:hypothetical protein
MKKPKGYSGERITFIKNNARQKVLGVKVYNKLAAIFVASCPVKAMQMCVNATSLLAQTQRAIFCDNSALFDFFPAPARAHCATQFMQLILHS